MRPRRSRRGRTERRCRRGGRETGEGRCRWGAAGVAAAAVGAGVSAADGSEGASVAGAVVFPAPVAGFSHYRS